MTRLVLIRHGESVAQVEGDVSGHDTCRGLSAFGRRQVAALRDRLSRTGEIRADVILTGHSVPMSEISNALITEWELTPTPFMTDEPSWHLVRFNDAAHLEGVQ